MLLTGKFVIMPIIVHSFMSLTLQYLKFESRFYECENTMNLFFYLTEADYLYSLMKRYPCNTLL